MNLPIFIDTDIGSDDCMAILLLAAERREKIAYLLSTYGNSTLRATTENLNTAKTLFGLKPQVVKGISGPQEPSPFVPDHDQTFQEYDAAFPRGTEQVKTCEDPIRDLAENLKKYPQCDYIALGPLTNLALLLQRFPEVKKNLHKIIIMGGAVQGGNITPYAEYNIYCDAQSAKEVFQSGLDIHLVPIDVCFLSALNEKEAELLSGKQNRLHECVSLLLRIENEVSQTFGNPTGILYDAVAAAYYLHPEFFTVEKTGLSVLTNGEKYAQTCRTGAGSITLVTGLDKGAYLKLLLRSVEKMEET